MATIATWNVNSLRARLEHVTRWCDEQRPDILALQETKVTDADFPIEPIENMGYQTIFAGQKSYNGVAILSRRSGRLIATDLPGFEDPQRRVLGAQFGDWFILNLYVPNGAEVGSEKYAYKLAWLSALREYVEQLQVEYECLILLGDFNIAPTDDDVHDPQAWQGKVLCSQPERDRLWALMDAGLVDIFRNFRQPPSSYSWWDYRAAAFRRNAGLRIDLILAGAASAARCRSCKVDKQPRQWDRPSDHAPVIAEFDLPI